MQDFVLAEGDVEKEVDIHADHATPAPTVLHGRVVRADAPGAGVDEARLKGQTVDLHNHGMQQPEGVADKDGKFELKRTDSEMYLYATSVDEKLKGMVMVEAGTENVTVAVGPTATARGRLVDKVGNALAGRAIEYGINIVDQASTNGLNVTRFGGKTTTGADGVFELAGIVPGQEYQIQVVEEKGNGASYWAVGAVTAERAEETEVGDLLYPPKRRRVR